LDGELLGVTARISPTRDPVHTMAKPLQTHWEKLAAGKRLDAVRFHPRDAVAESERSTSDEPLPESSLSDDNFAAGRRRATSATIRLRTESQRISSWSGVVVTADGYVVTCAHTRQLPGERVTVHFPDGRDAAGVVLGTNRMSDVGLVKITEDGPWPNVEIGDSFAVRDADRCIIAAYPASDRDGSPSTTREPLVQTVKSVKPPLGYTSYQLFTELAYEIRGGMSGGGVFDAKGRLVAVHSGGGNPRVEVVRTQWDQLAGTDSIAVLASEPLEQITAAFERDPVDRSIVVEVLGDGKRRALGTIVASDGRVVTKASELLTGSPSCRMPDGRVLPARVIKASREYDLALIQVDATKLHAAQWSEQDRPTIGTLLAALLPDGAPLVGTMCHQTRGIPAERVWRGEGLRDTDGGLEVHDLPKPTRPFTPIRRGEGYACLVNADHRTIRP
jgi:S1-C subfamily serine protease